MQVDSLDELRSAFAQWRKTKKSVREAVPEELLARAQRSAMKHGVPAVVRATGVEGSRLFRRKATGKTAKAVTGMRAKGTVRSVPAFSRLELSAPSVGSRPIAELETASGVKLRLFEQTPEMMGLLSAVCGFGGVR